MALSDTYRRQVELLPRTIPLIAKETCFALKGAIAFVVVTSTQPEPGSRTASFRTQVQAGGHHVRRPLVNACAFSHNT